MIVGASRQVVFQGLFAALVGSPAWRDRADALPASADTIAWVSGDAGYFATDSARPSSCG